ncbi:MAG: dihydrodipicolinate synthase family protein [Pirellulales bacterium]
MQSRLDGIFVPMFTPFTASGGAINEQQLRDNTRFLIERGIRILNPAGTTGEFWTLTPTEHRNVLGVVLDEAKSLDPSVIVVAGVSTPNLAMTLDVARYAVSCGADWLQLTPTYYLPMSPVDVVAYYKAVSDAVDVPVMVYEIPGATGVSFNCELIDRVCSVCPNVLALKTAAPLLAPWEFERIVRRFNNRLSIFAATGAYFSPFTYLRGVDGITDTLANAVPEFGLTLHRLARANEWTEMNHIYHEAFDVLEIEFAYGKAGLKEIGNACGRNVGPTRYPMCPVLTGDDCRDIQRRLKKWSFSAPFLTETALVGSEGVGAR